jgi:prolipoprotein diacylglyceryltransferase
MTPKDQAKELLGQFTNTLFENGHRISKPMMQQCALIAVDEIISYCPMSPVIPGKLYESYVERINDAIVYWFEVKKEINNL